MSKKMFVLYYYVPYDSPGSNKVFSTLKKAVEYCDLQPEAKSGHPKNPFLDAPHGWVIEEHLINEADGIIKYYNGNGIFFYEGKSSW